MCQHCEMVSDAEAKVAEAEAMLPPTLDYIHESIRARGVLAEANEWLDRVKRAECGCAHGEFFGRGYVENGVFKGHRGVCFRCGGKGYQNNGDRRRNWGYDQNRVIPA